MHASSLKMLFTYLVLPRKRDHPPLLIRGRSAKNYFPHQLPSEWNQTYLCESSAKTHFLALLAKLRLK